LGWETLRDYSFRPQTGQGLVLDARNTQNVPRANSKQQTVNGRNATTIGSQWCPNGASASSPGLSLRLPWVKKAILSSTVTRLRLLWASISEKRRNRFAVEIPFLASSQVAEATTLG